MPTIVFQLPDGSTLDATTAGGVSIMTAAVAHGVPGIEGDCGGSMTCATCHVVVLHPERHTVFSEEELEILEVLQDDVAPGSRLGCQVLVRDDDDRVIIEVPT